MGYVAGYKYDVFVSYASIDNEPAIGEPRGWVDILIGMLRRELQSRLGVRDLEIFLDSQAMHTNLPITAQLVEAVQQSATLLVVMSPAYLKSPWCDKERRTFLDVIQHRPAGSMFLVRMRPVARGDEPDEFAELPGIKFFAQVDGPTGHRRLGDPDAREPQFIDRVMTLGGELADQLHRAARARDSGLRAPATPGGEAPPWDRVPDGPAARRVFVAVATDDLEDREAGLRSHLDQAGLRVLPSPQARYPTSDLAAYEAAVLRDLESCCVFAQVLGPLHGKDLPFAPGKRLPALQCELARRAKLPVLQWRERDQAIDAIKDPAHHALLEAAQACGFEDFKRSVVERALHPPAEPTPRTPRLNPFTLGILVDADVRDHALELDIRKALSEMGVDAYGVSLDPAWTPAKVRETLKDHLDSCDGLVLVYGKTEPSWVQAQLYNARRLTSGRDPPLSTIAVLEGPPSNKRELEVTIKNLDVLDCREGLDRDKLRRFVEQLQR